MGIYALLILFYSETLPNLSTRKPLRMDSPRPYSDLKLLTGLTLAARMA